MSNDDLTDYKFKQLFQGLSELRDAMRDGFDEIKRLLDTRLESRDRVLEDHEDRLQKLERHERLQKVERKQERQAVVNAILATGAGAALSTAIGIAVRAAFG